jgi:hypothetical protein
METEVLKDVLVVGTQQVLRCCFRDKTKSQAGRITRDPINLTGKSTKVHLSIDGAAAVAKDLVNDPDQTNNTGEATYELQDSDLSAVTGTSTMTVVGELIDGADNWYTIFRYEITVKTLNVMLGVAA